MTNHSALNSARSTLGKALLAAGVALSVVAVGREANADERCRSVSGPFSSTTDTGPTCLSPIHLCTHGLLQGNFRAQYDFTFTYLYPAGDPAAPNKFFYGGVSVVTGNGGVMQTNDSGVLFMSADGSSATFTTNAAVASGERRFASTMGGFIATGDLNFVTGQAVGSYTGALCRMDRGHDD